MEVEAQWRHYVSEATLPIVLVFIVVHLLWAYAWAFKRDRGIVGSARDGVSRVAMIFAQRLGDARNVGKNP